MLQSRCIKPLSSQCATPPSTPSGSTAVRPATISTRASGFVRLASSSGQRRRSSSFISSRSPTSSIHALSSMGGIARREREREMRWTSADEADVRARKLTRAASSASRRAVRSRRKRTAREANGTLQTCERSAGAHSERWTQTARSRKSLEPDSSSASRRRKGVGRVVQYSEGCRQTMGQTKEVKVVRLRRPTLRCPATSFARPAHDERQAEHDSGSLVRSSG